MADPEKGRIPEYQEHDNGELPTLDQVLHRKTLPPVCLYNFYIIMRDRLHTEEYLDFYLDVSSHESLWKRYLKGLKRAGTVTDQELRNAGSNDAAGRALLNRVSYNSISKGSIRSFRPLTPEDDTHGLLVVPSSSARPDSPTTEHSATPGPEASEPFNIKTFNRNSVVEFHKMKQDVTREDVMKTAEGIYYRYIMPSAEKELHDVPKPILDRVTNMLENEGRIDPGVFAETKNAVVNIMETEHFQKFLRYKVWENTTWTQAMLRLVLGLFCLFVGFAVELSLIFLGWSWGLRYTRIWGLIPLLFSVYNLFVGLTRLDPIWVLVFGISETTTFHFNKIRQPIVRRILYSRAGWVSILIIVFTTILTVIFCVVPSGTLYTP